MKENCFYNIPLEHAYAVKKLVDEGVLIIQEGEETVCQNSFPYVVQLIKRGTDITCYGRRSPKCLGFMPPFRQK
jgi:hypothetical protein